VTFVKDVQELIKQYKDKSIRSSGYRREARDARDEVSVLEKQLEHLEERMADEKETAQRNRAIIDRFLARDDSAERRSVTRDNTPATRNSTSSSSTGVRVAKLLDPPLFSSEDRAMFDD